MAYPPYSEIEEALIAELRSRGKPTRPIDLYDAMADRFGLSDMERAQARHDRQPGTEWGNRVQWARRKLVERGVMVHRPREPWELAEWESNNA